MLAFRPQIESLCSESIVDSKAGMMRPPRCINSLEAATVRAVAAR